MNSITSIALSGLQGAQLRISSAATTSPTH
jgi:hypothetical protein